MSLAVLEPAGRGSWGGPATLPQLALVLLAAAPPAATAPPPFLTHFRGLDAPSATFARDLGVTVCATSAEGAHERALSNRDTYDPVGAIGPHLITVYPDGAGVLTSFQVIEMKTALGSRAMEYLADPPTCDEAP